MYGLFFPKFLAASLFLVLSEHFELIMDQLFAQEPIIGPEKMDLPSKYAVRSFDVKPFLLIWLDYYASYRI
jgi:hypothetical protein